MPQQQQTGYVILQPQQVGLADYDEDDDFDIGQVAQVAYYPTRTGMVQLPPQQRTATGRWQREIETAIDAGAVGEVQFAPRTRQQPRQMVAVRPTYAPMMVEPRQRVMWEMRWKPIMMLVATVMFVFVVAYATLRWQNDHSTTAEYDYSVGMGEATGVPSHFTVANAGGAVSIDWRPGGNYLQSRILTGPNLGANASGIHPKLTAEDYDGDGKTDLVLTLDKNVYWFPGNGKDGFGPMQSGDSPPTK